MKQSFKYFMGESYSVLELMAGEESSLIVMNHFAFSCQGTELVYLPGKRIRSMFLSQGQLSLSQG